MENTKIQKKAHGNRRSHLVDVKNMALKGSDVIAELKRLITTYETQIVSLYENPQKDWKQINKLAKCRTLAGNLLEEQTRTTC